MAKRDPFPKDCWFAFELNSKYGSGNRLLRFRGTRRLADVIRLDEAYCYGVFQEHRTDRWHLSSRVSWSDKELAIALKGRRVYSDYDRPELNARYLPKGEPMQGPKAILDMLSK